MYFRPPSRQALPFLVSLFDSEAYELYSTASGFGVVKKTGSSAAATASWMYSSATAAPSIFTSATAFRSFWKKNSRWAAERRCMIIWSLFPPMNV